LSPRVKLEAPAITPHTTPTLNRRAILRLGSGTALFLAGNGFAWAAELFDSARFVQLSSKLLQMDADTLDGDLADGLLTGLRADGKEEALKALADGKPDLQLEQQVIAGWYSGVQETAAGENLIAYMDALMWDAMDYTKPQGWCGGETGYWALPPSET